MNEFLRNLIYDDAGKISPAKLATAGAGLAALYGVAKPDSGIGEFIGASSNQRPVGYTGGIPEYGITRSLVPNAFSTMTPAGTPRRPGSGGRRYFTDTTYTPTGNTMSSAINPVNVPAQTQTGGGTPTPTPTPTPIPTPTTGGLFDALTQEEARSLLSTLFNDDGTGTTTADTGTTTPIKFTDTSVNDLISAAYKNYGGIGTNAHRVIAKLMRDYDLPVEQVARVTGYKPEEIQADYDAFKNQAAAATTTAKYSDKDVLEFIKTTYGQYGGPGVNAHREIAKAMNQYGVSPEQVARVTGTPVADVTADFKAFGYAQGGTIPAGRGYYLGGSTDGMADEIPATIDNTQPAALSDGEFVVPADVVSGLGNGNSDAGAKVLYSMMDRVRQARTGTKEQGRKIAPNKFTPA